VEGIVRVTRSSRFITSAEADQLVDIVAASIEELEAELA
jgi:hypothetical protein